LPACEATIAYTESGGVTEFAEVGDRLLVIYDGHCGFCNRSIRWFLTRDTFDRFRFAPSDSPAVAELLAKHGIDALSPSTMVVVRNVGKPYEKVLTRTDGVMAMLFELPSPWSNYAISLAGIPRPIRDLGYRAIARSRYHLAGRYATCPIPTAEERRHFL
jgi:predicted DCC family thiol-disulfide oxidoreductase YuxK